MISLIIRNRSDLSRRSVNLYFIVNGECFPDYEWTDLRDAPLSWVSELDEDGCELLLFMDGPYYFDVTRVDDVYIFTFFEGRIDDREEVLSYIADKKEYDEILDTLRAYAADKQ